MIKKLEFLKKWFDRDKFLGIVVLLLISLSVFIFEALKTHETTPHEARYEPIGYTVSDGETLWSLAEKYADGDPREWIYQVEKLNGMTPEIHAGEQIIILTLE